MAIAQSKETLYSTERQIDLVRASGDISEEEAAYQAHQNRLGRTSSQFAVGQCPSPDSTVR
jgi:hypothetical protein